MSEDQITERARSSALRYGRVTDAEGDVFTALLTPENGDGPELLADFSMARCGIEVEPGDLITVTPGSVLKVDLGAWTQDEIDEIRRNAREMAKQMRANAE